MHVKSLVNSSILITGGTGSFGQAMTNYLCNNVKKTIKDYQKFIKDNFKYVGENFAYEARSIHYDNKKKSKGIYGSASKKDLKELKEEGIDAQMITWVEDKDN